MGLALLGATYSCRETKKEKKEEVVEVAAPVYAIVADSTKVAFTAYKTTDKMPVGGMFKKVELSGNNSGNTPLETLNGLRFSIPVSSLFTNDATGTRDPKILKFFFGMMSDTDMIKGTFTLKNDKNCIVALTFNGVTAELPMDYTVKGNELIDLKGTINLEAWKALDALASLNEACKALHTGADGVSKTWSDVAVNASVMLKQQ